MADLLQSGVPLLRSLDVLAEQAVHPALAEVLGDVRNQVAEGKPLDEAMARHPHVFSELTISMVRAGSEGAFLEDALKRTADFLEKQEELRGRDRRRHDLSGDSGQRRLSCITVVLIVFFVPKFAELFARLEEQGGLPMATVVLLAISDVMGKYGLLVAAGLGGGRRIRCRRQLRTEAGRLFADRVKLNMPLAGKIFLGYAISRFCRVLGTLLRNGVPLLKSLEISSDSTGNRVLSAAIRRSAENVSSRRNLGQAAGRVRSDPAARDGHDQRRRGIEQPGQRADQHCRRHRSADEHAIGSDGAAVGAADAVDHGQRHFVRVDRAVAAGLPDELHR